MADRYCLTVTIKSRNPYYKPVPPGESPFYHFMSSGPDTRTEFLTERVMEVELTEQEYNKVRHAVLGAV